MSAILFLLGLVTYLDNRGGSFNLAEFVGLLLMFIGLTTLDD